MFHCVLVSSSSGNSRQHLSLQERVGSSLRSVGTMRRYGYTGSSSLRPNNAIDGSTLSTGFQVMALDRIADSTGNTVEFSYLPSIATGELLLNEVRYTGKVANRLNMSGAFTRNPYARTTMIYQAMPAEGQRVDYFAGAKMALTQRLASIEVWGPVNNGANPNTQVLARRYQLSYANSNLGSRLSRLVAVQECSPSSGGDVCYPPNRFYWNNTTDSDFREGYVAPASSLGYSNLLNFAPDFKVGDINGDGRQDLVFIKDRNCSGNPFNDLINDATSNQRFRFMVAQSNSTTFKAPNAANVFARRAILTGANNTTWEITSCTNGNPGVNFTRTTGSNGPNERPVRWDFIWHLYDMTGDGRDDLIVQKPKIVNSVTIYAWYVHAAVPVGSPSTDWTFSDAGTELTTGITFDVDSNFYDITGDGLPDLVLNSQALPMERISSGNLAYQFGAGRTLNFTGFEANAELYFGPKYDNAARTGDVNGDGIADVLFFVCIPPPASASASVGIRNVSTLALDPQGLEAENDNSCNGIGAKNYWVIAKTIAPASGNITLQALSCAVGSNAPNSCASTRQTVNSVSFADLNNDSYSDLLINNKFGFDSNNLPIDRYSYRMNRGSELLSGGLLMPEQLVGLTLKRKYSGKLGLADINGDQRLDIVYQDDATSGSYPLRAKQQTATGFIDNVIASGSPAVLAGLNPDQYLALSADLNGDGAAEWIRYKVDGSNASNLYIATANATFGGNDFIARFGNGLGVNHDVSYAPMVSKCH